MVDAYASKDSFKKNVEERIFKKWRAVFFFKMGPESI